MTEVIVSDLIDVLGHNVKKCIDTINKLVDSSNECDDEEFNSKIHDIVMNINDIDNNIRTGISDNRETINSMDMYETANIYNLLNTRAHLERYLVMTINMSDKYSEYTDTKYNIDYSKIYHCIIDAYVDLTKTFNDVFATAVSELNSSNLHDLFEMRDKLMEIINCFAYNRKWLNDKICSIYTNELLTDNTIEREKLTNESGVEYIIPSNCPPRMVELIKFINQAEHKLSERLDQLIGNIIDIMY